MFEVQNQRPSTSAPHASHPFSKTTTQIGPPQTNPNPMDSAIDDRCILLKQSYNILKAQAPEAIPNLIPLPLPDNLELRQKAIEHGKRKAVEISNENKEFVVTCCTKCDDHEIPLPKNLTSILQEICQSDSGDHIIELFVKLQVTVLRQLECSTENVLIAMHQNSVRSTFETFKTLMNLVRKSLWVAKYFEKCSVVWHPEPLRGMILKFADHYVMLRVLDVSCCNVLNI